MVIYLLKIDTIIRGLKFGEHDRDERSYKPEMTYKFGLQVYTLFVLLYSSIYLKHGWIADEWKCKETIRR
jgi:hypothetical protein